MNREIISAIFTLARPFSPIYGGLMRIREAAYRKGYLFTGRLPCPVVSVGNLSLGGTGKTPHVISIARWLIARGRKPAIISRGYGGKAGKGPLAVSDGRSILVSPEVGGDEPWMMAENLPGVPVIAGSDRYASGLLAVERFGSDAVILDDGFQHMGLARDVDLVLLPARDPFQGGRVFPGGPLREPVSALGRATAVIITKAEHPSEVELARETVHRSFPALPVFSSEFLASGLVTMEGESLPVSFLSDSSVLAFSGIADPGPFLSCLERLGARVAGSRAFPDHHPYFPSDIEALVNEARTKGADRLVTTAKDRVKLAPLLKKMGHGSSGLTSLFLVIEIECRPAPGLWRHLESRLGIP